ncbi:M48 family metalloprotease [Cognatiluteimonas profundi]|uniref:M48 family metalloprotease n=1 Tax=Cognatiluteimonas profundi TaxID=2594501 RepID=UPI00131C86A3|nr:M48 family metalloprotease [Lysobacter profundi]
MHGSPTHWLASALSLAVVLGAAGTAVAASMAAVASRPSVAVHSAPSFSSPQLTTLQRNAPLSVAGQEGLWFRVELPAGKSGYVRVNDVRMAYAGKEDASANVRALFTGKAGKGRVTETAGVRGLDESDLKSAGFDAAQLARLESYRLTPQAAAAQAHQSGLEDTAVAYAGEAKAVAASAQGQASQAQKRSGFSIARSLLSQIGVGSVADSALGVASTAAGKSEAEQTAEELALGPEIAGRILGAAPLVHDDAAQRRVNRIGRWMASHSSRPDLPWTFGVIDTSEINAFAAPGGYVLLTRGMYELLANDGEVAGVLGHEISHVVQRDHYNVIHKQEMTSATEDAVASHVSVGGGVAGSMAKDYVRRHGAAVMLTSLDRSAEYRSDEAAEIYLARSGYNPLSLYAVLQKMTALGKASASLAQLYKTHPPLADRLDRIDQRGFAGLQPYTQRN